VSIVATTPAENQNQQNDDQNRAYLSPSLREHNLIVPHIQLSGDYLAM
jgi:hypothetical protein